MGVDLTSPTFKSSVAYSNTFYTPPDGTGLIWGSTWAFDSTTVINVCSGTNGIYPMGCVVENLKISYTLPNLPGLLPFTNIGILVVQMSFS